MSDVYKKPRPVDQGVKNLETDKYVLFLTSEFSQWYPSDFSSKDGLSFNCAEQYMMYHKAKLFKDDAAAERIMASDKPDEHKQWGREVKNFDAATWNKYAEALVYAGNYLKFTQNPHLFDALMATKGKELVEAADYDVIWGIGLRADDPKAADKNNWQGRNLLGKTLTMLRDDLIAEGFAPAREAGALMLKFNDAAGQRTLYIDSNAYAKQQGFDDFAQLIAARDKLKQDLSQSLRGHGLRVSNVSLSLNATIKGVGPISNSEDEFLRLNPTVKKHKL